MSDNPDSRRAARPILKLLGSALVALCLGCVPGSKLEPFAATRAVEASRHGESLLLQEDLDAALAEFEKAIDLHPGLASAHEKIGFIQEQRGDYPAAAKAYGEAVKINPYRFDYSVALAQVYQKMSSFADAVRAYLHACELDPQSYHAHLNLGICYRKAGQLEDSVVSLTKAIELSPDDPAAHAELGLTYDAQGKYYEAINEYNQSLERNPEQAEVLINLGTTLIRQEDRWANARKALERAIDLDPKSARAYERLGFTYFRERLYTEALRQYEWAVLLDPRMPEAHSGLGVVRMAMYLQNPSQTELRHMAIEHWHRSLEANPQQPKIRELIEKYREKPAQSGDAVLVGGP